MKPIALIEKALENSSKVGDTVLDLFGGSGSTLIACEKLGRRAYLMELDPQYVDVIIKRWQDYTGEIALHESTGRAFNTYQALQANANASLSTKDAITKDTEYALNTTATATTNAPIAA